MGLEGLGVRVMGGVLGGGGGSLWEDGRGEGEQEGQRHEVMNATSHRWTARNQSHTQPTAPPTEAYLTGTCTPGLSRCRFRKVPCVEPQSKRNTSPVAPLNWSTAWSLSGWVDGRVDGRVDGWVDGRVGERLSNWGAAAFFLCCRPLHFRLHRPDRPT